MPPRGDPRPHAGGTPAPGDRRGGGGPRGRCSGRERIPDRGHRTDARELRGRRGRDLRACPRGGGPARRRGCRRDRRRRGRWCSHGGRGRRPLHRRPHDGARDVTVDRDRHDRAGDRSGRGARGRGRPDPRPRRDGDREHDVGERPDRRAAAGRAIARVRPRNRDRRCGPREEGRRRSPRARSERAPAPGRGSCRRAFGGGRPRDRVPGRGDPRRSCAPDPRPARWVRLERGRAGRVRVPRGGGRPRSSRPRARPNRVTRWCSSALGSNRCSTLGCAWAREPGRRSRFRSCARRSRS